MRILIIEDETSLALNLKSQLQPYYHVDLTQTGQDGLFQALTNEYDLIILDIGLPEKNYSGIKVCQKLRDDQLTTPVLILTGHHQLDKKLAAFQAGGDDYLCKPFHFDELRARVNALIKRSHHHLPSSLLQVGEFCLDVESRLALYRSQPLKLCPREFMLLEFLLLKPNQALSRLKILEHVWGYSWELAKSNTVDVHIRSLRKKLKDPKGKLIRTVHRVGYLIKIPFPDVQPKNN